MSIRNPHASVLASPVMEPGEISQLVERICSSRHLRRSQRLSAFLTFICSEALSGNGDTICEQVIGHRVFGRVEDYDPTNDNIVRIEASQLRKRLEAYFADEGSTESVIIKVPKGGYVPVFEPAPKVEVPLPAFPLTPAASNGGGRRRFLILGIAALALATAGVLAYPRLRRSETGFQTTRAHMPPLFTAFWSRIFDEHRPTLLCVADSNLALLQDLRGDSVSLTDYTSGKYLASVKKKAGNVESSRILSEIASRYYTSLGDATAIARLMMVNWNHGPVAVRYARDLNLRDLRSGNAILLGSARANPWVGLLGQKRRFHIEYDLKLNRSILRDRRPENGKPSVYLCGAMGEKPYDAYGIASVVPNLEGTGDTVLVAGSNMQGTEAATEFLTNAATFEEFLRKIGWKPDRPLPLFELVVKLVTVGGSSISSEIFAYDVTSR